MSDWNRLYVACKDATGREIEDIYDAHEVVEQLDGERNSYKRKLALIQHILDNHPTILHGVDHYEGIHSEIVNVMDNTSTEIKHIHIP